MSSRRTSSSKRPANWAIAAAQAADELFFHRAQLPAAQELHAHAAVAGDRADGQPMPERDAPVDHAVHAVVVANHLMEIRVMRQCAATLHDEIQHRVPGGFSSAAKASVPRTSSNNASAWKPPPRARVTQCCASTSSDNRGGGRASICPCTSARCAAAYSTNSSACEGTHTTWPDSPGRWRARPARCRRRAMPFGLPICNT